MTSQWYVVRTMTGSEERAAESLKRAGFEMFLPRVRIPQDQNTCEYTPLFPGYVFLRHRADNQSWPTLSHMPGIIGWVKFGDVVPSIPDEAMALLRDRIDAINGEGGLWRRYRPGEMVRVITGNMDSLAEVLEEPKSPQARIQVLLDFMGRQVTTRVSLQYIEPVEASQLEQRGKAPNGNRVAEQGGPGRRTRGGGRWLRGVGPRAAASV